LLDELCVDLGLCLPPHAQARLLALAFDDAEALTRELLAAEGLDPEYPDRRLYTAVLARVRRYYLPPPEPEATDDPAAEWRAGG
jgi:hypothetical protein